MKSNIRPPANNWREIQTIGTNDFAHDFHHDLKERLLRTD